MLVPFKELLISAFELKPANFFAGFNFMTGGDWKMVSSIAVMFVDSVGTVARAFLLWAVRIKAVDRKGFVVAAFLSAVVIK